MVSKSVTSQGLAEPYKSYPPLGKRGDQSMRDLMAFIQRDRIVDNPTPEKETEKVLREYALSPEQNKKIDAVIRDCSRVVRGNVPGKGWTQSIYHWGGKKGFKSQLDNFDYLDNTQGPRTRPMSRNQHYRRALQRVLKQLTGVKLEMVSLRSDDDCLDLLSKTNTSSGFTRFETGKRLKRDNREGALVATKRFEEQLVSGAYPYLRPTVPGCRTQAAPPYDFEGQYIECVDFKSRLIWMVDMFRVIAHNRISVPVQECLTNMRWYLAGYDDEGLSCRIHDQMHNFENWLVTDESQFDSSLQSWLMYDIMMICIKPLFSFKSREDDQLFEALVHDLIYKPIFYPGVGTRISRGGMGSGFPETNWLDSLCNYVMLWTYLYHLGLDDKDADVSIMGDDMFITSTKWKCNLEPEIKALASYFKHNFAVVIDTDGSKVNAGVRGGTPEVLSSLWTETGRRRPYQHLVAKILYPERERTFEGDSPKRADPYLIIGAFVKMFPDDMVQIMDIRRFRAEHTVNNEVVRRAAGRGWISGATAYEYNYGAKSLGRRKRVY